MDKTKVTLEIFTITRPDPKNPKISQTFYFTSADKPVTYAGHQYIPLSTCDAARWLTEDLK